MDHNEVIKIFEYIIKESTRLKDKHVDEGGMPVDYLCIFCQSEDEYKRFSAVAQEIGTIANETPTGVNYWFNTPYPYDGGTIPLFKIRKPFTTHPERGHLDFVPPDFETFKKKYLGRPGFKLMERPTDTLVELMDPEFDVRTYFPDPPLSRELKKTT